MLIAIFLSVIIDLPLSEIRQRFLQNAIVFSEFEVDCEWREFVPANFRESIGYEVELIKDALKDKVKRQYYENLLKGKLGGKSLEQFMVDTAELGAYAPSKVSQYAFRSGAVNELRHQDPDDVRKKSAEERRITSFTGSDFKIIQQSVGRDSWKCLEPYPHPQNTFALAWEKSSITVSAMLPPFWGDRSTISQYDSFISRFWLESGMSNYSGCEIDTNRFVVHRKIAVPAGKSQSFIYGCSKETNYCFPDWIAECEHKQVGSPTQAILAEIGSRIYKMRLEPVERLPEISVITVTYFGGIEKSAGGYYPRVVTHSRIEPMRTSETQQVHFSKRLAGVSRCGELKVTAFKSGALLSPVKRIVMPDRTSFINLDSQRSSLTGEEVETSLNRLVAVGWDYRRLVFAVNIVVVCILLIATVRKRILRGGSR